MFIHDDADMDTVVAKTVAAIKEGARHIGKADRSISSVQVKNIEAAVEILQTALRLKK